MLPFSFFFILFFSAVFTLIWSDSIFFKFHKFFSTSSTLNYCIHCSLVNWYRIWLTIFRDAIKIAFYIFKSRSLRTLHSNDMTNQIASMLSNVHNNVNQLFPALGICIYSTFFVNLFIRRYVVLILPVNITLAPTHTFSLPGRLPFL